MIIKKNNRGFSLVELLAAIVIMGILAGIAIVSVSYLLGKAEKEYYKAQEDEIVMTAKSYTQDNRNYLPKRVGQTRKILLRTLQEKKYIGDVVDRNKKKCDPDESYVQVYRYSKNNYSYVANLSCDNYSSVKNNPTNLEGPNITISFEKCGKNDSYDDAYVNVTMKDDDKISSYRYSIIRNGVELKNSGDIDGKLEKEITITPVIKLKEYLPGTIEIKVVAIDFYGNQSTKSAKKEIRNSNAPTCETLKANPTWTNNPPVEVQVKCVDYTGTGCEKDIYTQVFQNDAKYGTITVKDKSGNVGKCDVETYIDTVPPSAIEISNPTNGNWTNKAFSLEITSVDDTSGIAYFEYRYPDSTGKDSNGNLESEWHRYENSAKEPGDKTPFVTTKFSKERAENVEIRACDYAGNCTASVKTMIKIDMTAPSCTMVKSSDKPDGLDDWYLTAMSLTTSFNDPIGSSDRAVKSPISYGMKDSNTATYNSQTTATQADTKGVTWYGFIKDEAGNKATCNSGSFKVDTVDPTFSNLSNPYDNKWCGISDANASKYKITLTASDSTAGIAYYQYRYPNSTVAGENTWNNYSNSTSSSFTTPAFKDQMDKKIEFRVCDKAGRCSSTKSTQLRIDKENPTCVSSGGSDSWKNSVTLVGTCSDTGGSGCKANATKSFTTSGTFTNQSPGTVYDNAGNSVTCPGNQTAKIDRQKPTCTLKVSTSGVSFSSKSDDNGIAAYGLSTSSSATYNSTSSLSLSYGTFYGYVKDVAGNTNTCKVTVTSKESYSYRDSYDCSYEEPICKYVCYRWATTAELSAKKCNSGNDGAFQKDYGTCWKWREDPNCNYSDYPNRDKSNSGDCSFGTRTVPDTCYKNVSGTRCPAGYTELSSNYCYK